MRLKKLLPRWIACGAKCLCIPARRLRQHEYADFPLPLIFVVSLVLVLTACEIGHNLGLRADDRVSSNLSTLEASILGLLALMISFTFAMALSRFDTRRDAVLNEANAIGTTALRARLLPAPHNTQCLTLLREYVQIRLDIRALSSLWLLSSPFPPLRPSPLAPLNAKGL